MREPFAPPDIANMMQLKYWAINEAVYILSNSWPKEELFQTFASSFSSEIAVERDFIYLPPHYQEGRKDLTTKAAKTLNKEILHAIHNGVLKARLEHLSHDICFLIKPVDVITWFILKGKILSEEIQEYLKVYQIEKGKMEKQAQNSTKTKIVAQFLLSNDPRLNINEIILHELMRLFGGVGDSKDRAFGVARKNVNQLYEGKGKRGRQSDLQHRVKVRPFSPAPIPEILGRNRSGNECFNIPLLQLAMQTVTKIALEMMSKERLEVFELNEFVDELLESTVVKLYYENSSELIQNLIRRFCEDVVVDIFSSRAFVEAPLKAFKRIREF